MKGTWRGSSEVTLASDLCVLRGASVVINCRYSSSYYTVTTVGWMKSHQMAGSAWVILLPFFEDPSQHYRYLGNYISDCRLQINDVQHADAGNYVFGFHTMFGQETSKTSTKLSVKGNNRYKPASRCLNHPSNFTLFPVIQS